MKKVLGALLFIAGLAFVVWKFVFWQMSGLNSLLLNILGFMVMSAGAFLFGFKPNESNSAKANSNKKPSNTTKTIKRDELMAKDKPKSYETTDYSKYMPKQPEKKD